jgi:hypothetical protein
MVAGLAALLLASIAATSHPTSVPTADCWSGYSYDGVQSVGDAYGVGATLTLEQPSRVAAGDVAAWIGVGGEGLGPGGSDEWVQAGIERDAAGPDTLYYEYKRPGDAVATSVALQTAAQGLRYSFFVYERAAQADTWQVTLDGVKVGAPIFLPGSHGTFHPIATAENWDGGVAGTCNGYAFGFSTLSVRRTWGGGWEPFGAFRVLRDPAYRLQLEPSGFSASSR